MTVCHQAGFGDMTGSCTASSLSQRFRPNWMCHRSHSMLPRAEVDPCFRFLIELACFHVFSSFRTRSFSILSTCRLSPLATIRPWIMDFCQSLLPVPLRKESCSRGQMSLNPTRQRMSIITPAAFLVSIDPCFIFEQAILVHSRFATCLYF